MAVDIADLRSRAEALGAGYTRSQKVTMAATAVGVVLAVYAFTTFVGGSGMAPVYANLEASDAAAVTDRLAEAGIPFELADGGHTVMVAQDQVSQARIELADVELSSGDMGYGLLNEGSGITASEFDQQVTYQLAMEGELARTIEDFDSVEAATVHLALPEDQVFALDDEKPSASVMIDARGGQPLAAGQVEAIRNLVSSSIEGMTPEMVSIADSTGRVLAAPGEASGGSTGDAHQSQTDGFEAELETSLEEMLNAVVGPENSHVTVTAELDYSETEVTQETFSEPVTADGTTPNLTEVTSEEIWNGTGEAGTSGELGLDSEATDPEGTGDGSVYSLEETQLTPALNHVVETTKEAPGQIERLGISVLVNESSVSADQIAQIESLVLAGAGLDTTTRGDTLAVAAMPFDTTISEAAEEDLEAARSAVQSAEQMELIKTAAMGLGVFVMLIVAFLSFRRAAKRRREAADQLAALLGEAGELGTGGIEARLLASGAPGGIERRNRARTLDDELVAVAPDGRVRRQAAVADLIENQPDEVADLLRGWLADRRSLTS